MSGFLSNIKKAASASGSSNSGGTGAASETDMRFTIQPLYVPTNESGYGQWVAAMKMVAQLPGGIPPEFRRRLWLILADRHLNANNINWATVERSCFSEWSHPADAELGVQIVKDLHRTGCSLFCGEDGQENQALLKRVLLAYARWNKAVGYCQGFNMLAALILQVTDKCETDALKLMIYLIEGVLPESYFADSLRGLSIDMAVFRELLRTRLPRLSKHLDSLQNAAKEGGSSSYEPPLTNVFTMQWFLTLFCNCLPQPTVLRVWDLILLEGNEILLRTALAIWQILAERILKVRSADEFYCIMGVLMREVLEFGLLDGNSLIKAMVIIGPLTELQNLREHYLYNINPWGSTSSKKYHNNANKQLKVYPKERLVLDISALKKQYLKLKQRQRQAHIIFSAAISRHQSPTSTPIAMNHLLLGKSALIPAKRLGGPPLGSIPPARLQPPKTLLWKDAPKNTSSSSSSSDTELCDDPSESSDSDEMPESNDNPISDKDNIDESPIVRNETESDDDSDFQQFLEDRVRCLNEDDTKEEDRTKMSRRNSELALQIIQENSVILHRIMQCQSRLSPSPPIDDNRSESAGNPEKISLVLCKDESVTLSGNAWIDTETCFPTKSSSFLKETSTMDKSPEYGSRYLSILEKSRNLDEKYNTLILNAGIKPNIEAETSNLPNRTYGNEGKLLSASDTENQTKRQFNLTLLKQFSEKETTCSASIAENDEETTIKVELPKFFENLELNYKPLAGLYQNFSSPTKESSVKKSPTSELNQSMEDLFSKSKKDLFEPLKKQISLNMETLEKYNNSAPFFKEHKSADLTLFKEEDFGSYFKDQDIPKETGKDFYATFKDKKLSEGETIDLDSNFLMDRSLFREEGNKSSMTDFPDSSPIRTLDSFQEFAIEKSSEDYCKPAKDYKSPGFESFRALKLGSFEEEAKENTSPVEFSKPFKEPKSPLGETTNFSVSEEKSSSFGELSPSSRTYDPFPVARSPRRDKEIALKLGLYKK